ncbi:hypothetical protein L1987_37847 [Smallanthus sonchifolius]|uniref:Uncharacterized protein n=1 Tax=Smallanthus sonchifolius TaxID=185202 RepID=A0ACB9HIQ8_9ASTR|nr:hypothetical protein L1987_37847 [Smallanthus sonchifolius]
MLSVLISVGSRSYKEDLGFDDGPSKGTSSPFSVVESPLHHRRQILGLIKIVLLGTTAQKLEQSEQAISFKKLDKVQLDEPRVNKNDEDEKRIRRIAGDGRVYDGHKLRPKYSLSTDPT